MQTLVEIGPSKASQGQHGRKDATEQMKNLTHARIYVDIYIYMYTYIYNLLSFTNGINRGRI